MMRARTQTGGLLTLEQAESGTRLVCGGCRVDVVSAVRVEE